MKFYTGSDHAGFKTKEALKKHLEKKKIEVFDVGAFNEEKTDYPDFAQKVALRVAEEKGSFGLLFCGTGIGMSITANKIKGIRAANPFDETPRRLRTSTMMQISYASGVEHTLLLARRKYLMHF